MGDRVMHMAEAERRINQVKNDVDEIYGKLNVIEKVQSEHTKQLRTLNATVAKIWTTQQEHGDRLNKLDAAVAGLDEKLSEMRATQLSHENRFTKIDERFATQDRKLDLIMQALNISAN
jgi:septal ring factor EnvC (AmiA/AmiB activator)